MFRDLLHVPDQAARSHSEQGVPGQVDLVPVEALSDSGWVVVVIVVPAFAQREQSQKEIVSGIRNIRGEMLIKPSMTIKAFYEGGDKIDRNRSNDLTNLIKEIAGLESLEWIGEKNLPPSAVVVVENLKILIPLEGLIDPKEESQRLTKKIDKVSKEHKMLSSKLDNKKFTDNAPKELVQEQQERFEIISKELNNLNDQLKEIGRLL